MTKSRKRRSKKKDQLAIPKNYVYLAGIAAAVVILLAAAAMLSPGSDTINNVENNNSSDPVVEQMPSYEGGPRVHVSQDLIDYGDVKLGETVEAVFTVTNVGDEKLYFASEPQVELVEGC